MTCIIRHVHYAVVTWGIVSRGEQPWPTLNRTKVPTIVLT